MSAPMTVRAVPLPGIAVLMLGIFITPTWTQSGKLDSAVGRQGMVVSVSPLATEVGCQVLKDGGSAVDAAVALAFTLCVTWPEAGNIGGGGFMLVKAPDADRPVCIEYRETAPQSATEEMFQLGETHLSHRAIGVPGTVRGLALAHQQFGKLPWKDLVEPAIQLARDGFEIDEALADSLNHVLQQPATQNFPELIRVLGCPENRDWRAGDRLVQPDLAKTLARIQENGADGFYAGPVADLIVAEMQQNGGLITQDDLAGYEAHVRNAVRAKFHEYDVYGPPPPSSGGIVLAEMLNMLETFDLKGQGRWSPETIHLMAETMRRAYLDRALYLGDSDFVAIPSWLTTKEHARELASTIHPRQASSSRELAGEHDLKIQPEGPSTTHFSIIDGQGMAVSNTYTLEYSYGSRVMVPGGGFLLNNEMGDFNWTRGHTDVAGRIGTSANLIEPGKRMLSSQTPVIVCKQGEPYLVTGSPGGRTIINTSLCVVLNVLEFDMSLEEAVAAPRMHHQWLPDALRLEHADSEVYESVVPQLEMWGHEIVNENGQGDAHSILRDPATGEMTGVADNRRDGKAMGF